MPLYFYEGLSVSGAKISGEAVADSPDELVRELGEKGLLLQRVRKKGKIRFSFGSARRIRDEDRLLFVHQFAVLLRAGLTIPEALETAMERPEHPGFGNILGHLLNDVKEGSSLSLACARYPEAFDQLFVAAVSTSEKTGNIIVALQRYQAYLKNRIALGKKFAQAMVYPTFLMLTLGAVLALLFIFVLPKFVNMYADFGAELPVPTQILIHIVDRLPVYVVAFTLLFLVVWSSYRLLLRTHDGRLWIDKMKLKLPYYGGFYQLFSMSQLTRTLSALLSSGTALIEAIDASSKVISSITFQQKLQLSKESIKEGRSLAIALSESALLTSMSIKMIQVGEASGALADMLDEVADYYDEELGGQVSRLVALIEPLMMLIMGVLLGAIIIVMYLPIFSIADAIR